MVSEKEDKDSQENQPLLSFLWIVCTKLSAKTANCARLHILAARQRKVPKQKAASAGG
jgi:hypothetical protein